MKADITGAIQRTLFRSIVIVLLSQSSVYAMPPTYEESVRIDGSLVGQGLGLDLAARGDRLVVAASSGEGRFYLRNLLGSWTPVGPVALHQHVSIGLSTVVGVSDPDGSFRLWDDGSTPSSPPSPLPMGGTSVATETQWLVIGDEALDVVRIYRFEDGPVWILEHEENGGLGDSRLGSSAAIVQSRMIVGNDFDAFGATGEVRYRLRQSDGTWSAEQQFNAPTAQIGDGFGHSVSMSGDWLVVGAPFHDLTFPVLTSDAGAVYLYKIDGNNQYQHQATFFGSSPSQKFGWDVDIEGGALLVGAPGENSTGAAYLYRLAGSSWSKAARLVASDPSAQAAMGTAVEVAFPWLVVGAPKNDLPPLLLPLGPSDPIRSAGDKAGADPCPVVKPCEDAGTVYFYSGLLAPSFADGFESGDLSSWSEVSP